MSFRMHYILESTFVQISLFYGIHSFCRRLTFTSICVHCLSYFTFSRALEDDDNNDDYDEEDDDKYLPFLLKSCEPLSNSLESYKVKNVLCIKEREKTYSLAMNASCAFFSKRSSGNLV